MPTIYVSQTATNGFAAGSDANSGATPALAKLTLDAAVTGAIAAASANDTIVINDGTYTANNTATLFFNTSKTLTFQAFNAGLVTLRPGGAAQARVFNCSGVSINLTLTGINIDGTDGSTGATSGVTFSSTTATLALNDCTVRNTSTNCVSGNSASATISILGGSYISPQSAIVTNTALTTTGLAVSIRNAYIEATANNSSGGAIFCSASGAGVLGLIDNCKIRHTSTASNTGAVVMRNIRTLMQRCDAQTAGASASAYVAWITTNAAVLAENSLVRWNYLRHAGGNGSTSGMILSFGRDDGGGAGGVAGANDIMNNYGVAYGNFLTGTPGTTNSLHGLFFGWNKGGVATGNIVRHAAIPLIAKGMQTDPTYFINNVVASIAPAASGALRVKGSSFTKYIGNVVYMESTGETYAFEADTNSIPTVPVISTGVDYIANIFRANFTTTKATLVDVGSDAEFLFNDYDIDGVSGTPFAYTASTYATLALWIAAQELTGQSFAAGTADRNFWAKISAQSPNALVPIGLPAPPWGQ